MLALVAAGARQWALQQEGSDLHTALEWANADTHSVNLQLHVAVMQYNKLVLISKIWC